jgi:hypothetical protein
MIYRTYKAMRMLKTDEGGIKLADLSSSLFCFGRPRRLFVFQKIGISGYRMPATCRH